jgi:hypothetical protein
MHSPIQFRFRPFLLSAMTAFVAAAHAQAPADEGTNACIANLRNIRDALKHYREVHKEVPDKLSDLFSEPSSLSILRCPIGEQRGLTSYTVAHWKETEIFDPKTSYLYEFGTNPIPSIINGRVNRSMREWKRLQMGLVGGHVPIVRCLVHGGQSLNLGFDGEIYLSHRDWEKAFDIEKMVPGAELVPVKLFTAGTALRVIQVPERDPKAPPTSLDLLDFYNASLKKSWHSSDPANNLASLPTGLQTFHGVTFDVRGIVQLRCARYALSAYPSNVTHIPVGQRCAALHFLHAGAWDAHPGAKVGSYLIRYEGGQTQEYPILYGSHLIDWRSDPAKHFKKPEDSSVAWEGQNEITRARGTHIHLYQTKWTNRSPDVKIVDLDFVSAMADSGPFLIAITAEP